MPRSVNNLTFIKYILAGDLSREWILPPNGFPVYGKLGGHLPYTLSGLQIWDHNIGLLSKIGSNFPEDLLEQINTQTVDTSGITRSSKPIDCISFYGYKLDDKPVTDPPIPLFLEKGLAFPKELLGFSPAKEIVKELKSFQSSSILESEVPSHYLDASIFHYCPSDYINQLTLPVFLRKGSVTTYSIDASASYMLPEHINNIRSLLSGLTIFFTSEKKIRSLFYGKTNDLLEMADALISFGIEVCIIKCGREGQILSMGVAKDHWHIPAYPSKLVDPTGCGDAFCGGFLAGYRKTYDPLQSCLYGNVSASICLECSSPQAIQDFLPGLPQARLDQLKNWVRKI
jgi:sugar/nucleoside kinase (ribokinase family)